MFIYVDFSFFVIMDGVLLKLILFVEIIIKVFFYFFVFLFDIIGNLIVVFIIYVNKCMCILVNILIVNLVIFDILVGCFCMWVYFGN